jgi:hypothetical protein
MLPYLGTGGIGGGIVDDYDLQIRVLLQENGLNVPKISVGTHIIACRHYHACPQLAFDITQLVFFL